MHSKYLAEFYSTLSNIGFFAVAYYCQDYETLAIAIFSTLSHAIPLKRLNELDQLAAVNKLLKVLYHYDLWATSPNILTAGLATFAFGALGKFFGEDHSDGLGAFFHSAWHLTGALALFNFNQAQSSAMEFKLSI